MAHLTPMYRELDGLPEQTGVTQAQMDARIKHGARSLALQEQEFIVKDSGKRSELAGGAVRDTEDGKTDFLNTRFGPMLKRWAKHCTLGRNKYPDPEPGIPNWTLARGIDPYLRAKRSAARHFEQWLAGERDEDHAAAVIFNINWAEHLLETCPEICPCQGVKPLA